MHFYSVRRPPKSRCCTTWAQNESRSPEQGKNVTGKWRVNFCAHIKCSYTWTFPGSRHLYHCLNCYTVKRIASVAEKKAHCVGGVQALRPLILLRHFRELLLATRGEPRATRRFRTPLTRPHSFVVKKISRMWLAFGCIGTDCYKQLLNNYI